ncbi:MAG: discoidin domain-containing protein [Acidimicrobiales bacterium]
MRTIADPTRRFSKAGFAALSLFAIVGVVLLGTNAASAQAAADFVVNTTGDESDANLSDNSCSTAAGSCTLRAAIQQANATRGANEINFNIPGGGVKRIQLRSELPALIDTSGGTTINGYSQPGSSVNTAQYGSNAVLSIELSGTNRPAPIGSTPNQLVENASHGLLITSAENTVRGLSIINATILVEVRGEGADGNQILGNWIGVDSRGNASTGPWQGVMFRLGPDRNQFGSADLADRNVVSMKTPSFAMRIEHGSTSENRIQGNLIGLTPDLSRSTGGNIGIDLQWYPWGNLIGGPNPGDGNHIAGLITNGIDLSHSAQGNLVIGNNIGTNGEGTAVFPHTQNDYGIAVKDDSKNNYVADNVIGGSRKYDVYHRHNYTDGNTFVGNRFGVGRNGESLASTMSCCSVYLTGHDSIFIDNIIANTNLRPAFNVNNRSVRDQHVYFPDQKTERNQISQNTYYGVSDIVIDLVGVEGRRDGNDPGDGDDGAQTLLNSPRITVATAGAVFGTACPDCRVEIHASSAITATGDVDVTQPGPAYAYIGSARADASGQFSLASQNLSTGRLVFATAIDRRSNTSEESPKRSVGTAIARPGTARQSSTAYGGAAARAIDGNGDGRFTSNSTTHTGNDSQAWWELDLGRSRPIEAVSLFNRTDACCSSRLSNFYVLTSASAFGNRSLDALLADPSVKATKVDGQLGCCGSFAVGTDIRYIRVQKAGSGYLSLAEVQVFSSEQNIAVGSSATQSSTRGGGAAARAVDGNADGRWTSNSVTHTTQENQAWWQTDLGTETNITSVEIKNRTDCCGGRLSNFTVFVSAQPFGGRTHAELVADPTIWSQNVASVPAAGVGLNVGQSGRYVRVQLIGTNYLSLAEVLIFGDVTSTPNANPDIGPIATPPSLPMPAPYVPRLVDFSCAVAGTTLSWTDTGGDDIFYVFAITNSVETYLGEHTVNSLTVEPADTYRISYWRNGQRSNATCEGAGVGGFSCSVSGTLLSWTDVGDDRYYVVAINGDVDTYIGGFSTTSLTVEPAETYRVSYWTDGQKVATTCDGR